MVGSQRQQLDEAPGLAQSPFLPAHHALPNVRLKAAKEPDLQSAVNVLALGLGIDGNTHTLGMHHSFSPERRKTRSARGGKTSPRQ